MENKNDIRKSKLYDLMTVKMDCPIKFFYDDEGKYIGKDLKPPKWGHLKSNETTLNAENIGIICGKKNEITGIDLDINKNDDEVNGVEFFEKNICPLKDLKTLITRTPSGGYHLYFKYTNKIGTGTKLKYFHEKIAIDIRNDKSLLAEGLNYPLFNDENELMEVPEKLIEMYNQEPDLKKFEDNNLNDVYDTKGITQILNNLEIDYCKDYDKWLMIMITLKNLGYDIKIAKEFSNRYSEKYNERELEQKWNGFEKRDSPTMGTLLYCLSKSVSKGKYKSILGQLRKHLINEKQGGFLNDFEAYKLFSELHGNRIKTLIDGTVYLCDENNNVWYETKANDKYLRNLIEKFIEYLWDNEYEYDELKSSNKRKTFIEEILIQQQKRSIEFNEIEYLLPFENGILDLRYKEFRQAKPEENIFLTTGYNYKETEDKGELAFNFLRKMFRNDDELKCIINLLALNLEAKNRDERIIFCIGESASNGKSTLMGMIIKKVLGWFAYRFPTNLITGGRENSECGNPAVKEFKNKRFAYCSEPDASRSININSVKEFTGDVISVRGLFQNKQEQFKNHSTMWLLSQTMPNLEKIDNGIKRRIITVPFNIEFVDNPISENQEKKEEFTDEILENLKHSFLHLLSNAYTELYQNNFHIEIPEGFKSFKDEYLEEINLVDNTIIENFEYRRGCKMKSSEVLNILKDFKLTPREIKVKMKKLFDVDCVRKTDGMYYINLDYNKSDWFE